MRTQSILPFTTLLFLSSLLATAAGCGSDPGDDGDSNSGSGGDTLNGSGGNSNSGSGGDSISSSGGSSSGGDSSSSSGGDSSSSSGGESNSSSGGSSSGGDSSSGSGGDSSSSSGGSASGGAENGSGDPTPSMGCGQTAPAAGRASLDVGGTSREYILALPEGYDPDKAYKLIFTWHPWGGSAQQVAGNGPGGYYGLLGASGGEAILVSPEGLDFGGNGLGWGNEGGQDLDFLRAMMERFDSELCFDHSRVFSTGFSFGGMMSNAVACAGLARAIAPMAGNSSVSGCEGGTTPVAYMGFHGDVDSVVAISGGEAARDVFIERNGCGAATPSDSNWCELAGSNYQPCECTTYEGCTEGYPVTWCEFSGNHMVAPSSGQTIWDFFDQF